jgi:hypothetical protein
MAVDGTKVAYQRPRGLSKLDAGPKTIDGRALVHLGSTCAE